MEKVVQKLVEELAAGRDCVLVTLIAQTGSTPRGTGTLMLVGAAGLLAGTVGGGAIEARSIERGMALTGKNEAAVSSYDLSGANHSGLGMVCGGGVTVLFAPFNAADAEARAVAEAVQQALAQHRHGYLVQSLSDGMPALLDEAGRLLAGRAPELAVKNIGFSGETRDGYFLLPLAIRQRVVVCGGGHVARSLVPVLAGVDFRVTVVENRPDFVRPELFPQAEQVLLADYNGLQENEALQLRPDDFIVVMTHGHAHDFAVQEALLRKKYAYIGVIGSRTKIAAVNERLRAAGISEEAIASVHTPIGLPIGAVTPAEIAISVAAECIAVRAELRKQVGAAVCPSTL